MSKLIEAQLKVLSREKQKIAKQEEALIAKIESQKALAEKFNAMMKEAGYKRPKPFIKALMEHFGIVSMSLETVTTEEKPVKKTRARKNAKRGRPSKSSGKRKRVTITAEIRDQVKDSLENGSSKKAAADEAGISYPVVTKIINGAYDAL